MHYQGHFFVVAQQQCILAYCGTEKSEKGSLERKDFKGTILERNSLKKRGRKESKIMSIELMSNKYESVPGIIVCLS